MKFSRFLAVSIAAIGLSVSANAADLRAPSDELDLDPSWGSSSRNSRSRTACKAARLKSSRGLFLQQAFWLGDGPTLSRSSTGSHLL